MNDRKLLTECAAEFVGTALLVFFGVGCVAALKLTGTSYSQWEVSIVWGLGVAIAIYCTAGISGAHLNPAITIAFATNTGFSKKKIIPYIVAQTLGAFIAAGLVYYMYFEALTIYEDKYEIVRGISTGLDTASVFTTYAKPYVTTEVAFIVELTITAILTFCILAINDDKNGTPNGAIGPLLIGVVIAIIGGSVGPLTGFAMNPARDIGPKMFLYLNDWGTVVFTGNRTIPYFLVPLLAPVVGAVIGGWAYIKIKKANIS
ncbi:aquaporin [Photobacterium leiognathi]|uniref:MIP/aquaporin family protein n=1 Tax=Photobacterium leiognathi TaxID=553611 RepID=UPI001EDF796C|nr:MIP/aquaporin family protein [Photobacterium leiognathi]MCG3884501.1 aquaporin [Photobacterium leiognathi]